MQRQFSGPITTYFVEVEDGAILEVDVLSTEDPARNVGRQVFVSKRKQVGWNP
ncbi:MAG: hypothetical protein ACOCWR_00265 [Oceanidesulfovibrio sp.]